ncbi:hypothetical protein [Moraxella lacunata]|uniref:hypothetical protein n=1 Tax=Moraxella lacunata TaxID=477 RepID=UPI003EE04292
MYFAIKSTPKVSVSNFWGAVHIGLAFLLCLYFLGRAKSCVFYRTNQLNLIHLRVVILNDSLL